MKTRNLLVAMALPTLFAACTAEEIVNQADNNAALENRALLGDLVVNAEGNVASRAAWSEENLAWGAWEEGDAFTAALTDAVTEGTAGDKLYTNYVWTKNAAGEWSTTSQMVQGLYAFYSYKGNETKNDRNLVKFDITNQTADLDNPTKVLDDNQLFFSPLYDIKAANTTAEKNVALPLTFYPYHSIAAFYIKNATDQDLQISQIVAKGSFQAKGEIKPAKIQDQKFVYSVRKDANGKYLNEYTLPYKTNPTTTTAGVEFSAKEVAKMWEMSDLSGAETVNQIVLNCENWTLAEGEEVIAYMNMPAGEQTTFSVEINVVDAKGNAKTVYVQNTKTPLNAAQEDEDPVYSIASTGLSKTSFKRGTATAVFGLKNGQPKAIEISEKNLANASGIYVDNEAALLDLIADGRGDVLVYNAGDLVLNATIADALAENTACNLIFANAIAIQDFENAVNLTKVTFEGKVTVKDEYDANEEATEEGTVAIFGEDVFVKAGLEVEAYSAATLANGEYNAVTNKGTMTLYAEGAKITGTLKNEGTLTADNGSAPESEATSRALNLPTISVEGGSVKVIGMDAIVTLKKGNLEYEADVNANGKNVTLNVTKLAIARTSGENAKLTIGEDVTWVPANYNMLEADACNVTNGAIAKKLSLVNNGTVAASNVLKFADLENNGEIETSADLIVYGTCTNNGEISAKNSAKLHIAAPNNVASAGTLANNGNVYGYTRVDKGGNVTMGEDAKLTLENGDGEARVNNTNLGKLNVPASDSKYIVYYEYDNANLYDWYTLKYELYNINTIVINGTFTFDNDDLAEVTSPATYFSAFSQKVTRLEMNNGSKMKVVEGDPASSGFSTVVMNGEVTLTGWSASKSILYLADGSEVVLKKNSIVNIVDITLGTGHSGDGTIDEYAEVKLANETLGTNDKAGYIVTKDAEILTTVAINSNVEVKNK